MLMGVVGAAAGRDGREVGNAEELQVRRVPRFANIRVSALHSCPQYQYTQLIVRPVKKQLFSPEIVLFECVRRRQTLIVKPENTFSSELVPHQNYFFQC